jgi:hypothetical protein
MIYSNEIITLNDGLFMVKNYKKYRKIFTYLFLLCSIIFLAFILLITRDIKNYLLFPIFYFASMLIILIYIANDVKEIIFNINEQKIIFKYGLFFRKTKEIGIGELNEISINNTPADIYNRAKRITGKKYNVDLIDKNLNAYRIYQSIDYTDELKTFAKNISGIINVELIDKNNVEGYMKIFKKIII